MRRRALLSAATGSLGLLAGCSMFDGDEPTRDRFDVTETSRRKSTAPEYDVDDDDLSTGVTLRDTDDALAVTGPEDVPTGLEVTTGLFNAPTDRHPATVFVEASVPETASDGVTIPPSKTPPLDSYRGTDPATGSSLLLVPEEAGLQERDVVRRDVGCWRPILPVGPETEFAPEDRMTPEAVPLEPGESVARAYFLVTPWSDDRCLPEGQYPFESGTGWRFWLCSFDASGPPISRFHEVELPHFPRSAEVHWFHDPDAPIYVQPESEQVGLPSATNRFTFTNRFVEPVTARPDGWALYKLAHDGWYPIAPLTSPAQRTRLLPGQSMSTELRLFTDPDRAPTDERDRIGGLGPGRYALNYPFDLVRHGDGPHDEDAVTTLALFEVVGPSVDLTATGAVDHVSLSEDVLHAYTTRGETSVAVLRLARIDSAPSRTLVREQVLQRPALRDALVLLRDADPSVSTVAYHVDPAQIEQVMPWIDPNGNGVRFAFEGDEYAMTYA